MPTSPCRNSRVGPSGGTGPRRHAPWLLATVVLLQPGFAVFDRALGMTEGATLTRGDDAVLEEEAAWLSGNGVPPQWDPIFAILQRIDAHLHRLESDGVTRDPRNLQNPTEEIRLTIVPQLLGYTELYRTFRTLQHRDDILNRADYLVAHFNEITSRTAFDGMLGYALLAAYEVSGDARHLEKARIIVARCKRLDGFENTLNWGLMSAMALAKYHAMTGDPEALDKARRIIISLANYQHADGSFPHWCPVSKDVHYTAWIAMELVTIGRLISFAPLDVLLERTEGFLRSRVGSDGVTVYEGPCTDGLHPRHNYWSAASGCPEDYDTRGWLNELGYNALVFDHFRRERFHDVMGFVSRIEEIGLFADKWDYFPAPEDPMWPWVADASVIRTSMVFWSFASVLADREGASPARYAGTPAGPPHAPPGLDDPRLSEGETVWPAESLLVALQEAREAGVPGVRTSADMRIGTGAPHVFSTSAATGTVVPHVEIRAADMSLAPSVPQPTSGEVSLRFVLPWDTQVRLTVFDAAGRRVRTLIRSRFHAGTHVVRWDTRDAAGIPVAPGLYFVSLEGGGRTLTQRLVVVR